MTALDTGTQIAAHIENLNLFGCLVETTSPLPAGTNVRVRISHRGMILAAEGKVAYSRPGAGMGIEFASIEPGSIAILDNWLTEAETPMQVGQPPKRSTRKHSTGGL